MHTKHWGCVNSINLVRPQLYAIKVKRIEVHQFIESWISLMVTEHYREFSKFLWKFALHFFCKLRKKIKEKTNY